MLLLVTDHEETFPKFTLHGEKIDHLITHHRNTPVHPSFYSFYITGLFPALHVLVLINTSGQREAW